MFAAIIGILFVVSMIAPVLEVIGLVIGAVFSGVVMILKEVFAGREILLGLVMGLVLYFRLRKRNEVKAGEDNVC